LAGLVECVVVASSDKAYGAQPQLPYTEEMSLLASHPYDVSKACVDLLARGSEDQVRQATLDLLEQVAPGGGHILASGNTITSYVNPRNYKVMLETHKAHGARSIHI
ncbi:MAG: hypothetical protein QF735_12220, partial [Phycisphaeraceae bacterium]|nr:hypothetical protein [Phycisphaeraceae bacterium]